MAKRGPKGKPPHLKIIHGTDQPCRRRERVTEPVEGEPKRPKWLTGTARQIWDEKIAVYKQRGQNVAGLEGGLAQYVRLEAHIIKLYRLGVPVQASLLTAHRLWANEFFDTPSTQFRKPGRKTENRFAKHLGKPPDSDS